MDNNPEPSASGVNRKPRRRKPKQTNKANPSVENPAVVSVPTFVSDNRPTAPSSGGQSAKPTRSKRRLPNDGITNGGVNSAHASHSLNSRPIIVPHVSVSVTDRSSVNQPSTSQTPIAPNLPPKQNKRRRNRNRDPNANPSTSSMTNQNVNDLAFHGIREPQTQKFPPRRNGGTNTRYRPSNKKMDYSCMTFKEKLIYQLENNVYECMICFQNVTPRQKVWSCKQCYHVFHISGECILNWAKKSVEESRVWNCPACKSEYSQIPSYFCYCGKVRNPQTRAGDRPHACEGLCLAKRGVGCIHLCNEPCHPGPCTECTAYVKKTCSCGKTTKSVRCGQTVECFNQCDKLLSCSNHKCVKKCHEGDCDPCEQIIEQKCFCGETERELECGAGLSSLDKFSCDGPCPLKYSCGIHKCTNKCHDTSNGCGSCPTAVDRISYCPCGKMSLKEANVERTSCTDPIPTCSSVCNKVLSCGDLKHRCNAKCHTGDCPPCTDITSKMCRCKKSNEVLPCSEIPSRTNEYNEILCKNRCKKRKSCGIHKCNEPCCVSTDHTCLQVCNRKLSCGLHFCDYICHSGLCRPCLNASFTEQFCECGKTVRYPPIPCGAPLPQCDEVCMRAHSCSHPVLHRCHSDENCPPCTVLTEKLCYGGHELRKNIQCHFSGVSCGKPCGKRLPCGVHDCNRNCHPGECIAEGAVCSRPCPVVRSSCEHSCSAPCHPGQECPESKCVRVMEVTCTCGRRKGEMKCHDMVASIMRMKAAEAQAVEGCEKSQDNLTPGVLKRSLSVENMTCLSCTDDCKKVARNKKLADALSIVTDAEGLTDEPTVTFTEALKDEFRKYPSFVHEVEATLTSLAKILLDATVSDALSHSFRPMHIDRRRFIHNYAELFCMTTVSVDDPPKRSVIVTARRSSVRVPLILLSDLQKYPSLLKSLGEVTLRNSPTNDPPKKVEPQLEKGMQPLKTKCKVFKRIPIASTKLAPLKQHNFFSVLCSDAEDENDAVVPQTSRVATSWWSDEEDHVANEEPDVTEILSECIDRVLLILGEE